jgi:hypothetical protein
MPITYSECVSVDLFIQHAERMRHTVLLSVACPALHYFSTLSHKRHHFRKSYWSLNMLWFSLKLLSETVLILNRSESEIFINVHRYSFKVTVILVGFYWNWDFLDRFSKNNEISNFTNIFPMEAELFSGRTDRQTDRSDKANSHTAQFAKAPKNNHKFYFTPVMYYCPSPIDLHVHRYGELKTLLERSRVHMCIELQIK